MASIFGEGKIFENCQEYIAQIPCGSKIVDEIALSSTVKEIEANLCFSIFWHKFENTKWRQFSGRGKFLKIAKTTLLRYRVGRKFRRNHSISHG